MHGICFSFEERIGCAKAARPHAGHANPACILAARLNARGCVSFWRRMHGSAAPSKPGGAVAGQTSNPHAFWQSASMHGVCVYHLWAGLLHGDLSTHKPVRHNPHECISARILNASAPRTRVWECEAMLRLYMAIWARTNRFVTTVTNTYRHGF